MGCIHESCGGVDKVWLPYKIHNELKGLKPHPFCIHCGAIKNISQERLRTVGFYMNVLARIDTQISKITKVQMRLIAQELENSDDFHDTYAMTRDAQDSMFIDVVTKYCDVLKVHICSMLRS
ncbi:MAG: hypothetical protein K0A89_12800 [ANME-2 cluster archaeon]|nr:hypothetical protein [ANME-2 cluster archaeon]